jgi:hypothetical protein
MTGAPPSELVPSPNATGPFGEADLASPTTSPPQREEKKI